MHFFCMCVCHSSNVFSCSSWHCWLLHVAPIIRQFDQPEQTAQADTTYSGMKTVGCWMKTWISFTHGISSCTTAVLLLLTSGHERIKQIKQQKKRCDSREYTVQKNVVLNIQKGLASDRKSTTFLCSADTCLTFADTPKCSPVVFLPPLFI